MHHSFAFFAKGVGGTQRAACVPPLQRAQGWGTPGPVKIGTTGGMGRVGHPPTNLQTHVHSSFFSGWVKPQPGDISIVEKTGTFLMWYDIPKFLLDTGWHLA